MNSKNTETKMLSVIAHEGKSNEDVDDEFFDAELPQLGIAPMILDAFVESQERPHRINDKRHILHDMSLARWMLRIAGILTPLQGILIRKNTHVR